MRRDEEGFGAMEDEQIEERETRKARLDRRGGRDGLRYWSERARKRRPQDEGIGEEREERRGEADGGIEREKRRGTQNNPIPCLSTHQSLVLHHFDRGAEPGYRRPRLLPVDEDDLAEFVLGDPPPAVDAHLPLERAVVLVLADVVGDQRLGHGVRVVDDEVASVGGETHDGAGCFVAEKPGRRGE